jgi:hypothetical protein
MLIQFDPYKLKFFKGFEFVIIHALYTGLNTSHDLID